MAYFALRFDFRNPSFAGTTMAERYRAALDMVEWADGLGFVMILLSEHHGSDDGYLPSPLTMAAAMAARTKRVRIQIAAVVAPFYDPLRLAEDIAVVDNISDGRLEIVVGNGYVAREFEMFGKSRSARVQASIEAIETLRGARDGDPFEFRGRTVTVTPPTAQPDGPRLLLGATVEAGARRAAHVADGFVPSSPELWEFYRDEMRKIGKSDPGSHPGGDSSFFHLAQDPTAAWEQIAPFALHEVNSYGGWLAGEGLTASGGYRPVTDAAELARSGQYQVFTPDEYVARLEAAGPTAYGVLHPMMGGIPPALAWDSLRLLESDVLPRVQAA